MVLQLWLVGQMRPSLTLTAKAQPPVIGIIGDPGSTHSIAISSVLGLFRLPMV